MADVSLKEVFKSFDKTEVIHGISCDIKDGEFIVILGPSGCGKSTVLRMIAGLEVITAGEIEINGKVVNQLEPADRDIAMVFQNYAPACATRSSTISIPPRSCMPCSRQ